MEKYLLYLVLGLLIVIILIWKKLRVKLSVGDSENVLEDQVRKISEQLEKNFESLANKSLAQNAEYVQKMSSNGVALSLTPLLNQLKDYQLRMEKMVRDEEKERVSMIENVKYLSSMNQKFSDEAKKFMIATRGNIHAIGRFGEDTLENILQASGLNEDVDYLKQKRFLLADKSILIPDFVLLAPNSKGVVIDSKLSLDSYMKYMEAGTPNEKAEFKKELAQKINNHLKELSKKEYQKICDFTSFNYVMMFIASDAALSLALAEDRELLRKALKLGILIVGPTTLMASIKTVEFLWKEEKQVENYKELGRSGQRLYEKCFFMIEKMKDTQKHLSKASDAFDVAFNHLNRGDSSIVCEAFRLKELGIHTDKVIKPKAKK